MPIRNQKKHYKKNRKDLSLCSALIRLTSLALSQTDPDRIISQILKDIRKIFNAKLCWIFLVEDNKIKLQSPGDTRSRQNLLKYQLSPKLSPEILKRNYPIISNRIGELYKKNRVMHRFLYERNINKFMGVLLKANGKLIGALNVARDSFSPSFTKEDQKHLALLSNMIVITERKRAEEALRESESKYRDLTEKMVDVIYTLDTKGNVTSVNEVFKTVYGFDPEKVIGKNFSKWIPKEKLPKAMAAFKQILRGEKITTETVLIDKQGKPHDVEFSSTPIIKARKVVGTRGIIRDITERKRAEETLKLFSHSVDSSVDGIAMGDPQGRITYVNEAFVRMFGYSREELIGKEIAFIYAEDQIPKLKKVLKAAMEGGWRGELVGKRKDGELFPVSISASRVVDEEGKVIAHMASHTDITERKRAEEALWKSENKYRTLLENLPQKIFFKDKNSVYISCNENYARDLNIKLGEIAGKTDYDFFPKKLAEKYKTDDKRIMESGEIEDIEEVYIQDGQKVFVHTVKTPIKDKNGNIVGVLGIFWDITERKRANEALIRNEQIARERARLLTDLRNLDRIDDILARVCQAVRDSGLFERSVMTLHDQVRQIVHLGQVGLPPDVVKRARQVPPIDQKTRARLTSKKFRISDSFFIPAEAGVDFSKTGRYVPQKKRNSVGGDWQPGDELFVPLRDFSRKIMGFLSVDTPTDNCRPDIRTIETLEMLVESAAARVREVEAHKTLRRSEEYFRSIIENASDIVAILDRNGVLRYQSPSFKRVFGYKPEEVIDKNVFEFIHPDDVPGVTRILARVIQNPSVIQTAEYRARHKDGSWHNLEATGRSLLDNPAVRGIVINYRDITDRKQAEEALRESEEKYRKLINTSVDGVISVDPQMKIILWNPGAEKMFGYTEEEMLGQSLIKIVPERYRKAKEKGFVEFKKIGSGSVIGKTLEFEGLKKGGTEIPIELSVSTRRVGKTYIATSIVRDITKRKQAEEALGRSEKKYRTLVETAQEGIGITDPEENLIFVNQAFADLLGYEKEKLLGKNLNEISDQTQYAMFKKETKERKKGAFSKYEAKLLSKNGKPKYVYISSAPLWNEDGSFMGALGVFADLTDIKKAREYNILFDTSRALSQTLRFDQVLKTGAQKMIEVLNADRCAVLLTEDDAFDSKIRIQVYPLKKENVSTPVLNLRTTKDHFSSYKRSLQKQKYIRVFGAGFDSLPELGRKILRKAGISSSLIIPIFLGKKMLGVFHVGMTKKNRTFTEEETRLILTMANQLAIALQNCKLMEDLKKEHTLITEQAEMLKRQTLEKDILLKISRALSKTMDMDEVGKIASQVVGSALGVNRCVVTLATQDDNQLEIKGLYTKEQTDSGKLIGTKFSWDDIPAMSDMVKKGKFFAINDISDLPPRSKTKEYFLKAGINSVFGAGMFFGKKLIGILSISSSKAQEGLSQEEVKLIQTIANQIAVAIENARLLQVVKKHTGDLKELSSQLMKVQENERKRIAQELHDEVGQMLQSMKMNLDRIKRNLSSKPQKLEGIEDWLLDTEKLLGQTIDDIRTLTFELRPSMLDDFGLIPTLRWFIENYAKRSNIQISLKAKNQRYRFSPDIEVTLYRIIQEALTNVAKHAHATEVTVLVSKKDSSAILSVKDNGVGFDANRISLPWKGMGLLNIRERVNLLGGNFEIISRPMKGTRININIPFRR